MASMIFNICALLNHCFQFYFRNNDNLSKEIIPTKSQMNNNKEEEVISEITMMKQVGDNAYNSKVLSKQCSKGKENCMKETHRSDSDADDGNDGDGNDGDDEEDDDSIEESCYNKQKCKTKPAYDTDIHEFQKKDCNLKQTSKNFIELERQEKDENKTTEKSVTRNINGKINTVEQVTDVEVETLKHDVEETNNHFSHLSSKEVDEKFMEDIDRELGSSDDDDEEEEEEVEQKEKSEPPKTQVIIKDTKFLRKKSLDKQLPSSQTDYELQGDTPDSFLQLTPRPKIDVPKNDDRNRSAVSNSSHSTSTFTVNLSVTGQVKSKAKQSRKGRDNSPNKQFANEVSSPVLGEKKRVCKYVLCI